jgi:hypothetical protein
LTTGGLLCGRSCQALFIGFPAACTHGPCGRPDGIVALDLCWWLRDPWSSLAPNDLLSVLTSLGQAPDPACALGACEARGGHPLLILGSLCEPVPRNELPTPAHNPFSLSWGPVYSRGWSRRTPPPCARLPLGVRPSSGSARVRSGTSEPAPPSRCSAGAHCPGQTVPDTTASAGSQVASGPRPTPSPRPSSA